jgi:rare lipoprotein A
VVGAFNGSRYGPTRPAIAEGVGALRGKHVARRTPGVRSFVPALAAVIVGGSLVGLPVATGWLDRMLPGDSPVAAGEPPPSPGAPLFSEPDDLAVSPAPSRGRDPRPSPSPSGRPRSAPLRTMPRATRSTAARSPSPSPTRSPTVAPAAASDTCGVAYYDSGAETASGELFDRDGFTAAHPTLAFDTRVRVTNPATGWSIVVRINDRGPAAPGRCLDLTPAAFSEIAPLSAGVIQARYEVLS